MGWTGYPETTAREALGFELRGSEILAQSGNWAMWRNKNGHVGLTYFLTSRGKEDGTWWTYVKEIDITMGPPRTPPASIARKFVAAYGGDIDAAGGEYGAPVLREALARKTPGVKVIPGYTTFTIGADNHAGYAATWKDGAPFPGEYVWLGKYRARRMLDGQVVRLPRNWRRRWLTPSE